MDYIHIMITSDHKEKTQNAWLVVI